MVNDTRFNDVELSTFMRKVVNGLMFRANRWSLLDCKLIAVRQPKTAILTIALMCVTSEEYLKSVYLFGNKNLHQIFNVSQNQRT